MKVPGLIVKKIGMTRVIAEDGQMIPVTLVQADKQQVTKILTAEKDGYAAIQVGYFEKPERRLTKPDVTRLRKSGVDANYSKFKEIRCEVDGFENGQTLNVESFAEITNVDVTGLSKGRGFQGAPKRHNTATGRRTHGSRFHRRPGSLGANTSPGRVMKNKKMPGHMGVTTTTVQNLRVVDIDKEQNLIALKGSVPGQRYGYLLIRPSVKAGG
jgi:large subunit ribosomal protein L3